VKWNKFPSHTWLPYLTPNGVTLLNNTRIEVFSAFIIVEYQLFTISFFIKTMPKKLWILNTLPNGVTHLSMPLIDIKSDKTMQKKS